MTNTTNNSFKYKKLKKMYEKKKKIEKNPPPGIEPGSPA